MKLRARLQRLEQQAPPRGGVLIEPWAACAEEQQLMAYLQGQGRQPPCAPHVDPLKRDTHLRVECCLLQRARGALKRGEYLPNMTEDDCREVDQLVTVIGQWDWAPPWFKEP